MGAQPQLPQAHVHLVGQVWAAGSGEGQAGRWAGERSRWAGGEEQVGR